MTQEKLCHCLQQFDLSWISQDIKKKFANGIPIAEDVADALQKTIADGMNVKYLQQLSSILSQCPILKAASVHVSSISKKKSKAAHADAPAATTSPIWTALLQNKIDISLYVTLFGILCQIRLSQEWLDMGVSPALQLRAAKCYIQLLLLEGSSVYQVFQPFAFRAVFALVRATLTQQQLVQQEDVHVSENNKKRKKTTNAGTVAAKKRKKNDAEAMDVDEPMEKESITFDMEEIVEEAEQVFAKINELLAVYSLKSQEEIVHYMIEKVTELTREPYVNVLYAYIVAAPGAKQQKRRRRMTIHVPQRKHLTCVFQCLLHA